MIPTKLVQGRVYAAEYAREIELSHEGKRTGGKEPAVRVQPPTGLQWGKADPDLLHAAGISMEDAIHAAP